MNTTLTRRLMAVAVLVHTASCVYLVLVSEREKHAHIVNTADKLSSLEKTIGALSLELARVRNQRADESLDAQAALIVENCVSRGMRNCQVVLRKPF